MHNQKLPPWRLSVAPMMDCTDRNYRYLARLISARTLLYTEMIVCDDVVTKYDQNDTLGQEVRYPRAKSSHEQKHDISSILR